MRARQIDGARFRRQVPLGPYIADFVCLEAKLVIEVDGGHHSSTEDYDARRTTWLEDRGWRVVRFWNNDVADNLDGVLVTIRQELSTRAVFPHPNLPPQAGEGGSV